LGWLVLRVIFALGSFKPNDTTPNVNLVNQSGATLDIQTGTLALTQGYSDIVGSKIQGDGVLDISGASVSGIAADIGPGASPGILGLIGTYTQDGAAGLNIEIGGQTPGIGAGFHDQLVVTGPANLNGTLNVALFGGYTPKLGDLYTVMTASSIANAFPGGVSLPPLAGGMTLDSRFAPASVEIGVRQTTNLGIVPTHLAVNTGTDTIYVVQASSQTFEVFDPSTGTSAGQTLVDGALNLSYIDINEARNKLYMVDGVGPGVHVLDGATRTIMAQLTVGTSPTTLAWHRTTDSVYVMTHAALAPTPLLYVIDGTSFDSVYNQSTRAIGANGSAPGFITVDEVNDRIFAGLGDGFIVRMRASDKAIIDSVTVGSAPQGIVVNRNTRMVYVADQVDKTVTVIDDNQPSATAVIAVIPTLGGGPVHLDIDEGTNLIFAGEPSGVTVIDGAKNAVRTFIANTPTGSNQVAFHPGRGMLYFTNTGGRSITTTRP
jgi:DNA-binding beta-propeller fold protein YncE